MAPQDRAQISFRSEELIQWIINGQEGWEKMEQIEDVGISAFATGCPKIGFASISIPYMLFLGFFVGKLSNGHW